MRTSSLLTYIPCAPFVNTYHMITNKLIHPMKERAKAFSHAVHEGGRLITFLFEPVFMIDKIKYLVTVSDAFHKTCVFYMEKTYVGWKIINAPQIADHYLQQESVLAKVIESNSDY